MHIALSTIGIAFGIFFFIIWIYAIVDIAKNKFTSNDKIVWLLLVILLPCIGTILYFLIGRKNIIEEVEEFV